MQTDLEQAQFAVLLTQLTLPLIGSVLLKNRWLKYFTCERMNDIHVVFDCFLIFVFN